MKPKLIIAGLCLISLSVCAWGEEDLGFTSGACKSPDPCASHIRANHRPQRVRGGVDASGNDIRPARWCGFFLRHHLGVADRKYNLARNWAHYGSPANGPAPGVIAVFAHHVGIVTAVPGPGKIILLSGNDGGKVRERERSSRGVIAWRWPGNSYAAAVSP